MDRRTSSQRSNAREEEEEEDAKRSKPRRRAIAQTDREARLGFGKQSSDLQKEEDQCTVLCLVSHYYIIIDLLLLKRKYWSFRGGYGVKEVV